MALAACGGGSEAPPGAASPPSAVDDGQNRTDAPPPGSRSGGPMDHEGGQAGCTPSGTSLSIAAKDLKFDKQCLAVPASQPFTITFRNNEALPHNVAIVAAHDSNQALFRGEIFSGPASRDYQVNPLNAGKYHFHCDVHPEMQGDFIVG